MDLILLLIGIAFVGLLVYVLVTYVQMAPVFKQAIIVVAIIGVLLYVARQFGVPLLGGG
jgi:hypothetical protein